MISRIISKKLKALALKFPVVAVMGPRQSGKTTLARHVFSNLAYVSLEDMDTRQFASKDPRGFLSNYAKGAIIDEIQRVPELFSYIQTAVDAKNKTGQFILTGSQNFLLQENISQTLAGRVAILRLLPLSLEELKASGYSMGNSDEYILKGFYPRLYDKKIDPRDWYPSYIDTYVERDVRLIKNVTQLDVFQKFIRMCAGRVGQILNLSSLGQDCGITHNTAKAWLSLLESSYIVFLLKPYYKNFNKRLVKMPKLYFYDTGLACSLLGIDNKAQLETHYLRGGLFESFIISEMVKNCFNQGRDHQCYYWRDKTGHEIDCVVENKGVISPIEIKSGRTVADDYFDGIRYWQKISGKTKPNAWLIYNGADDQKRSVARVLSWKNTRLIFNRK